jgi:hypothetical protein
MRIKYGTAPDFFNKPGAALRLLKPYLSIITALFEQKSYIWGVL